MCVASYYSFGTRSVPKGVGFVKRLRREKIGGSFTKHKAAGQRWFWIDNTGIKKDHWIVSEIHGYFPDTELEHADIRRVAHFETREDALCYIMLTGRLLCDDMPLEQKKAINGR